jgi:TatD DNase family protein
MLFDSHTHLNLAAFDIDRENLILKYLKEGIFLINVGTFYETSKKAVELASKYENCWASVGLHPSHLGYTQNDPLETKSKDVKPETFNEDFIKLLDKEKVIAIGECGLDYSYLKDFPLAKKEEYKKIQEEEFRKQIKVAKEYDLPLILHIRDLYLKALEILEEEKFQNGGVFHFFTGSLNEAQKILEKGYYLGFSGVITYSDKLDEVIKNTPLERILIETDAPYVAPYPYKGKRNEPAYVIEVSRKIALIKNLSLEEILKVTFENTKRLFKIA